MQRLTTQRCTKVISLNDFEDIKVTKNYHKLCTKAEYKTTYKHLEK